MSQRSLVTGMVVLLACLALNTEAVSAAENQGLRLFTFGKDFDSAQLKTKDATVDTEEGSLVVRYGTEQRWPTVTFSLPAGKQDLSEYRRIAMDVQNLTSYRVVVSCRIDSPGGNGKDNSITEKMPIGAGQKSEIHMHLPRPPVIPGEDVKFIGMRGVPEKPEIDPHKIVRILVFVSQPDVNHSLQIDNVRAEGYDGPYEPRTMDADEFFPFIDKFGQYRYKEWPGKTHSVRELKEHGNREATDLEAHSGPEQWDKYGGWEAGPQFEATGYFYPKKHAGKWWLVDPEGHLFWSHGVDCVRFGNATTPISERKHYFSWLPDKDSRFGDFYGRRGGASRGYYEHKSYENFNFTAANLLRKFGDDWRAKATDQAHRRLRSWGMNTIGNWSDSSVYLQRRTPYVVPINIRGPSLEASKGLWRKFHDVFDPRFRQALRRRLAAEEGKSANDPWCIGHFIDNELSWGSNVSLAVATLRCPKEQAAKQEFVKDLRDKYGEIEKLNRSWGADHDSWDALLVTQKAPDKKKASEDLKAFYKKTVDTYYRICREEHDRAAPKNLYLGSRIHSANETVIRTAAKYCEVVGFNRYSYTARDLRMPEGIDKPAIIGEFHFGALDRGMFHTGLRSATNQHSRAAWYRDYVQGALDNPIVVGTHWFQYGDQATTGRFDGENYQIGFVDFCDKPYQETVEACRTVGYSLYERRLGSSQ